MAGMLGKLRLPPEVLMALIGGGVGYAGADEGEDPLMRAAAGAGITGGGTALGRSALRGLLGRVPVKQVTMQDKIAQTIAARRALGQQGSQATQFPSRQAMQELEKYGDLVAMEKYGDKIGESGVDRMISGVDELGRLGSKLFDTVGGAGSRVWDGIDAIAHRAAPIDRANDLVRNAVPIGATAGLGAAAYTVYELINSGNKAQDEKTRATLLQQAGFDPTPTGLMMFQAQNGLPPTGQWDEQTIITMAHATAKRSGGEEQGPPAPSLAPHNQR